MRDLWQLDGPGFAAGATEQQDGERNQSGEQVSVSALRGHGTVVSQLNA
jgi:hypothetical protein